MDTALDAAWSMLCIIHSSSNSTVVRRGRLDAAVCPRAREIDNVSTGCDGNPRPPSLRSDAGKAA